MHVANIMPQDQKVYIVKAKFHYAIWFDAGSKLVVRSWSRTCKLVLVRCKPDDRPNFSSLQVCDQLRTSFEPDSVMEFGLKLSTTLVVGVARAHLHMYMYVNHLSRLLSDVVLLQNDETA